VTTSVLADDPLAFGIDKLRHARTATLANLARLDAAIPADRATEWDQTRRQLPDILQARRDAERAIAERQAALQDAGRRRWGRHDHQAITAACASAAVAEQHLEQATAAEHTLREQLDVLSQYQQQRQQAIRSVAPEHHDLETNLAQLDAAIDHTRPDRVRALVDNPPQHLVERLGPPPSSPAGRAVWCHHTLLFEAALDRNDGVLPPSAPSQRTVRARQEITLADRYLDDTRIDMSDPVEWQTIAQQAARLVDQAHQNVRAWNSISRLTTPGPRSQWSLDLGMSAHHSGPELEM
jgi:hypothetical protein